MNAQQFVASLSEHFLKFLNVKNTTNELWRELNSCNLLSPSVPLTVNKYKCIYNIIKYVVWSLRDIYLKSNNNQRITEASHLIMSI